MPECTVNSGSGRGCVKTQEAVATTQQRNRRPGLSKISDARETWDLNQSCTEVTRQKVFTQPRPKADLSALAAPAVSERVDAPA